MRNETVERLANEQAQAMETLHIFTDSEGIARYYWTKDGFRWAGSTADLLVGKLIDNPVY